MEQDLQRISRATERLICSTNEDDGWGLTIGQASSIVNTAEALSVIKMHGQTLDSTANSVVTRAQHYIARNAPVHILPRKDGGRGENVRYVSFALNGMLQFPELISKDVFESIVWCINWLKNNKRDDGWAETVSMSDTSIGQTAIITSALCLAYRSLPPYVLSDQSLLEKLILHGVTSIAKHRRADGWWPARTFATTDGSPTKTSLAVNALIEAKSVNGAECYKLRFGEAYSKHAREALLDDVIVESVLCLEKDYPRWIRHMEDDREVPGTDWKDPAYAAATWACANGGLHPDSSEAIRSALVHIRALWNESDMLWCDGPRSKGTLRSTFHTVRALKAVHSRIGFSSSMPDIAGNQLLVTDIVLNGLTLTCRLPNGKATVALGEKICDILRAFILSADTKLTANDIGKRAAVQPRNVAKYVARLNEKVRNGSNGYISTLIDVSRGKASQYSLCYHVTCADQFPPIKPA